MGFFDRMQRDYQRRMMVPVPFLIVGAVLLFFLFSGPEALRFLHPAQLSALPPSEWEGACVVYDVPYIYAQYMQEFEYRGGVNTGQCVGGGYLIDWGRDGSSAFHLLGLYIHGDQALLEQADALARASRETETPEPMRVWGTVRAMEPGDRETFSETIARVSEAYDGAGRAEGLADKALPYYIDAGRIGGRPAKVTRGLLLLTLPLLLFAVWRVIQALRSAPLRPLEKKLKELGGGEVLDALLDSFYEETQPIGGILLGWDFVLLPGYTLLRPWEIVWAYPENKCCVLRTLDGHRYDIVMPPEEMQALMLEIQQMLPGTVVGYDEETAERYQTDRDSFAKWWDQSRPGCYQEVIEEQRRFRY